MLAEVESGTVEDLNALLLKEQVELLLAQCAHSEDDRRLHCKEAFAAAKRIERHAAPYRSRDKSGHVRFDAHSYDGMVMELSAG
ncbi:hypothetical protein [Croceicoccus naphthovorans]|uniref:Uncharacterized protein n=1 Tax=Croceicoccus naphthovorans TaxID=1348774 RepID=A0A0G3XDY6_9SPHN|nr:hypothetical protein [Croceicoccus naphthovorans]AKM08856.1 hypothetical protein AB433_00860 [Croceicoccus naphthovorans]MBB3992293.1 tyrosine-protein phosphatase YwqE [Croceicoccus naphthovorans]